MTRFAPAPKMPRLAPAVKPPLPALTLEGAYDPAGMLDFEIARHLRVPLHRVIYWSSEEGRRRLGGTA